MNQSLLRHSVLRRDRKTIRNLESPCFLHFYRYNHQPHCSLNCLLEQFTLVTGYTFFAPRFTYYQLATWSIPKTHKSHKTTKKLKDSPDLIYLRRRCLGVGNSHLANRYILIRRKITRHQRIAYYQKIVSSKDRTSTSKHTSSRDLTRLGDRAPWTHSIRPIDTDSDDDEPVIPILVPSADDVITEPPM